MVALCHHVAQQSLTNHEQVHQCEGREQSIGILGKSSVAHLGEAELQLQHAEHMLDFRAHPRLRPVLYPLSDNGDQSAR